MAGLSGPRPDLDSGSRLNAACSVHLAGAGARRHGATEEEVGTVRALHRPRAEA